MKPAGRIPIILSRFAHDSKRSFPILGHRPFCRFDADQARRKRGKERQNMGAPQCLASHRIALDINAVDLEDVLGSTVS
jgi:hypothetical protein